MDAITPRTGWSMSAVAKLMNISTRETASGMFFATSEDEPTFFVSTTSRDALEDAVRCALDIQESIRARNLAYPQSRQMIYRIGITVADVVERDGDLLGDGVNIAARLGDMANPGGICVSRAVYEQVANKLSVKFEDLGQQQVKNIPNAIHAYGIAPHPAATAPS